MAEDIGAKFVRINAAKKAAADLRQQSSICKTPYLREEGELLANEAVEVIKQVEAKVTAATTAGQLACTRSPQRGRQALQLASTKDLRLHMAQLWESHS